MLCQITVQFGFTVSVKPQRDIEFRQSTMGQQRAQEGNQFQDVSRADVKVGVGVAEQQAQARVSLMTPSIAMPSSVLISAIARG